MSITILLNNSRWQYLRVEHESLGKLRIRAMLSVISLAAQLFYKLTNYSLFPASGLCMLNRLTTLTIRAILGVKIPT